MAAPTAGTGPFIELNDGLLTVRLHKMPLADVLQRVAEQARIAIVLYGESTSPITIEMSDEPLEEAFRRLLRNSNFSFIYKQDAQGTPMLVKVVIVSPQNPSTTSQFNPMPTAVQPSTMPASEPTEPALETAAATQGYHEPGGDAPQVGNGIFVRIDRANLTSGIKAALSQEASTRSIPLRLGTTSALGSQAAPETMQGVELAALAENGLLASFGLQNGDVVTDVNGLRISQSEQFVEHMENLVENPEENAIRIEVERGDTIEPIYIELE